MTAPLSLSRTGNGWLLLLRGDWSLAAMPGIGATRVEVQSQESIHPHDAYAISETS